jgi:hypothetical protein
VVVARTRFFRPTRTTTPPARRTGGGDDDDDDDVRDDVRGNVSEIIRVVVAAGRTAIERPWHPPPRCRWRWVDERARRRQHGTTAANALVVRFRR